ncbi:ComEA family DNA-binding protein [Psychrobacter sp. AOP7-B1-25]|uniref:ComEA family DNA-binding protein n=1 Tax=Psychrobacter sp. AOP7-B1-25 TaxID=3457644 RepID=UPI00402B6F2C
MNAHHRFSFASLLTTTVCSLLLSVVAFNNANADPCFNDPKRAYEYLIAKEKAITQGREQKIININRASEGELVSLDGIGSSKAQAIILYRDMFGDFKTVGELAKVKGIGAKTVEKNQRRLSVRD